MIAKAIKGRGFRGTLDYDLGKDGGEMLETNMAGESPKELAAEFGEIRKLRPNLEKAVLHVSISAAPGENLTNEQWREVGNTYLEGMGFEKNQYVMTRHNDTDHEHIHIIANRIRYDGSVTSDSQDYKRQEVLMRQIEQQYGLEPVAPSNQAERRAPTKGEIEGAIRTGEPSAKQRISLLADAAAKGCTSFTAYQERLEAAGVQLVPVVQQEGAKLSGLSYRLDDVTMKGSDLGRAYSPAGLQKRGVTYEQDRDIAAVRSSQQRDATGPADTADRGAAPSQDQERGRAGAGLGADRAGDGRTDRPDSKDAGRDSLDHEAGRPPSRTDSDRVRGADRAGSDHVRSANDDVDLGLDRSDQRSARHAQGAPAGNDSAAIAALPDNDHDGHPGSAARERILALGQPDASDPARRGRDEGASESRPEGLRDRTTEAITRQIDAMGVDKFVVAVTDRGHQETQIKVWSRAEMVQGAAWLKRMNARGADIEIHPARDHGLVFLKNVSAGALAAMKADGNAPAATIEVSPGRSEVWIKVSNQPMDPAARKVISDALAKQYGASADESGHLAGFTTKHSVRTPNPGDRRLYALAKDCPGSTARNGPQLVAAAETHVDRAEAQKQRKPLIQAVMASQQQGPSIDPVAEYRRQAKPMLATLASPTTEDLKAVDLAVARAMAMAGRTASDIEQGISKASPALESRQPARIEVYARAVAAAATAAPDVVRHRQEQERVQARAQQEQEQARGRQAALDRGRTPTPKPRRERDQDQDYGR